MRVPIACSLTAGGAELRLGEWQQFLARDVRAVSGPKLSPADIASDQPSTSVRLLLATGDDVLLRAVDLAERERECCQFFDFVIQLGPQGRWLSIGVPPDAAGILTDLLTLLPAELPTDPDGSDPSD